MDPLDAALLSAWDTLILPRLATDAGRAELVRRVRRFKDRPLRSFALCLRANDRRIPDHNTAGAVFLDADEVARLCAPINIPPPGLPRIDTARELGIGPSALTGRVRSGQLVRNRHPNRADRKRDDVRYHTAGPIDPAGEVRSAPWLTARRHLHQRPAHLAEGGSPPVAPAPWRQTLHRELRHLRAGCDHVRFEWRCPDCFRFAQRLYWPFRPMTLPAFLYPEPRAFDPNPRAVNRPPPRQRGLQPPCASPLPDLPTRTRTPFTPGFTCRQCLRETFGGRGLVYESAEFTTTARPGVGKNTWHLFIQRLTLGLLHGNELCRPDDWPNPGRCASPATPPISA